MLNSFQKTRSTQTGGSVFRGRIYRVKTTEFELELIKIEEFFHDSHGDFTSDLVSFKKILMIKPVSENLTDL